MFIFWVKWSNICDTFLSPVRISNGQCLFLTHWLVGRLLKDQTGFGDLRKVEHISWMITLSMITIISFYCKISLNFVFSVFRRNVWTVWMSDWLVLSCCLCLQRWATFEVLHTRPLSQVHIVQQTPRITTRLIPNKFKSNLPLTSLNHPSLKLALAKDKIC